MKKTLLPAIFVLAAGSFLMAQDGRVGINTTDPKATFDIHGTPADASKLDGIIAPRLTGNELANKTYTTDQTGAMVYVTAAAGPLVGQVINVSAAGYYYFDGTVWQIFKGTGASTDAWKTLGNSGTTRGTNFIGTTDDTDLMFKTNGKYRMHFNNHGGLAIGDSTEVYNSNMTNNFSGIRSEFYNTDVVGGTGDPTNPRPAFGIANLLTANIKTGTSSTGSIRSFSTRLSVAAESGGSKPSGDTSGASIFAYRQPHTGATDGTGIIAVMSGLNIGAGNGTGSVGTTSRFYGVNLTPNNQGAGTITDYFGYYMGLANGNTGTITNKYGVYIANDYNNYFNGKVGIGTTALTAPTNQLHVKATTNPVRFEGLATGAATDNIVTVDASGVLTKSATTATSLAGADLTNDAWINNDANNSVDLPYAALKDDVSYTANGYKKYDKTGTIVDNFNGTTQLMETIDVKNSNIYDSKLTKSKSISTIDATNNGYISDSNILVIDADETRASKTFVSASNSLIVGSSNATNQNQLVGGRFAVTHFGTGTANIINAMSANGQVFGSAKANQLNGAVGLASLYTSGNVTEANGVLSQNYVSPLNTGTIGTFNGVKSTFDIRGTAPITNLIANSVAFNSNMTNYTGTITNYYDFYSPNLTPAGTITNKYGLYLRGADKKSYLEGSLGIGTAAGVATNQLHVKATTDPVRFEGLQSGTMTATDAIVYTDNTGVLKTVTAASVASATEPWFDQATGTAATSNTQNIYQTGKVAIGFSSNPAAYDYGHGLSVKNSISNKRFAATPNYVTTRFNGTEAAPSGTLANEWIGANTYEGSYVVSGTTMARTAVAGIYAYSSENTTATGAGGNLRFATTTIGTTAPSEKMKILDNGNVGIGITNPTQLLDVQGKSRFGQAGVTNGDMTVANKITAVAGTSGSSTIEATNAGANGGASIILSNTGAGGQSWTFGLGGENYSSSAGTGAHEGNLVLYNGGTDVMNITKITNNVGIGLGGVTTATNKLHVKATTNPVRIEGLVDAAPVATDAIVYVDNTGVLKKSTTSVGSLAGADLTNDAWINNTANTRVELGTKSDGTARTAGTEALVTDAGNFYLGTTNPGTNITYTPTYFDSKAHIYENLTNNTLASTGVRHQSLVVNPELSHTGSNAISWRGAEINVSTTAASTANYTSQLLGLRAGASHYGTGTVSNLAGQYTLVNNSGPATNMTGLILSAINNPNGNVTGAIKTLDIGTATTGTAKQALAYGINNTVEAVNSGGGIGTYYASNVNARSGFGHKIDNYFGYYVDSTIDNITGSGTKYAFYNASAAPSYLAGSLGVGTAAGVANAKLHVVAAASDLTPAIIEGAKDIADANADGSTNDEATTAGIPVGGLYRTGDLLKIRH